MTYKVKLRKSLILLIFIVSLTSKSFSQTDTNIVLSEKTARLVVKDLVTFDGLSAEHAIAKQTILTLQEKVSVMSSSISNLQAQLLNQTSILERKDFQIENYKKIQEDLEKALKRERRTKKLYKISSTIGAVLLLNNMISK